MGITGTEVTKEAAVMILTDDNFSTIVKAVELGRGLYDNLTRYIRYQMGCLFGFIISFLGASIFDIAGGGRAHHGPGHVLAVHLRRSAGRGAEGGVPAPPAAAPAG
jgi:magnesium-transporting ATPase (P-type)